jgi:hypothetical protein
MQMRPTAMWFAAAVSLATATEAMAKPKPERAAAEQVPDIEELLQRAGWTITPEMSAAYAQPGDIFDENNTLLKNGVDCFDAEVKEGAYASMEVNRSLETGVRMQVMVTGSRAEMGIQKKMTFDTPILRRIPQWDLIPNASCLQSLRRVENQRKDISGLYVITESLSAIIQKQECGSFSVEAGGWVISGDAKVQQLCEQTSLEPVAVAFKTWPVTKLLAAAAAIPGAAALAGGVAIPSQATNAVDFGQRSSGLGVEAKLQLQRCDDDSKQRGARARQDRLETAVEAVRAEARKAWKDNKRELTKCTELKRDERGDCITTVKAWLREARAMTVSLPAGEEPVDTDCGLRQPAFPADSRTVAALEVNEAERLLERLKRSDTPPAGAGRSGSHRSSARTATPGAWKKPVQAVTGQTAFITLSLGGLAGLIGALAEESLKDDVLSGKVSDKEWEKRRGNINGVYVACYALIGTGLVSGGVSLAIDVDGPSSSNGTSSTRAGMRWTRVW